MSKLSDRDLAELQAQHPDYRMELVNGEIRVMSPSGYESDEVAARIGGKLFAWVDERKLGRVTASSAGFSLGNTRAPDASFVRADRLPRSPRGYATIPPDLMVEVKSPTDTVEALREKIDEFLSQGTIVGILINPDDRTVEVRQVGQEPVVLVDGEMLTVPSVLPEWEVPIVELWPPVFE